MERFAVTTERPYDILIGKGILDQSGKYIKECVNPCRVCIITDSKVNKLYSKILSSSLEENGFKTHKIVFPEGEYSKSIATYANVLESLAEKAFSRSDIIIALGGGVVGDLSGFAAATYLRGSDISKSLPHTLLQWIHQWAEKLLLIFFREKIWQEHFGSLLW